MHGLFMFSKTGFEAADDIVPLGAHHLETIRGKAIDLIEDAFSLVGDTPRFRVEPSADAFQASLASARVLKEQSILAYNWLTYWTACASTVGVIFVGSLIFLRWDEIAAKTAIDGWGTMLAVGTLLLALSLNLSWKHFDVRGLVLVGGGRKLILAEAAEIASRLVIVGDRYISCTQLAYPALDMIPIEAVENSKVQDDRVLVFRLEGKHIHQVIASNAGQATQIAAHIRERIEAIRPTIA